MCSAPVTFGGGIMMQKVSVAAGVGAGAEGAGLFPGGVEARFGLGGVEGLFHAGRVLTAVPAWISESGL